jgi:Uma2 family endonuclease
MVVRHHLPNRPFRHFTVDEYEQMVAVGILTEYHPVELMHGVVTYRADHEPPQSPGEPPLVPYHFTVDEYHRLIDAGILGEDERVELINGEIVCQMPIGDRHAGCVNRLNRLFNTRAGGQALVSVQNPVQLVGSEPQPDVALLVPRADDYASGKPHPADVLLLIEVADSSFETDRDTKGLLYAQNGIPEYWVVDLNGDSVLVYRGPRPDGTWAAAETRRRGDTLTVAALPGVAVAVADILP